MNNIDISSNDVEAILKEDVIPRVIQGRESSNNKNALLLSGQPGSGKSAAAREILKGNDEIVFINGDDLRVYHPRYYKYLSENDIEAADLTQGVVNYWIESLIDECIKRNISFAVEGTMRNIAGVTNTAKKAKLNDYRTKLVAISTPYELSLESINRRYAEAKARGDNARFTKKESHDEAYENIEPNLKKISELGVIDEYHVSRRLMGEFRAAKYAPNEMEKVLEDFRFGREREISDVEKEMLEWKVPAEFRIKHQ